MCYLLLIWILRFFIIRFRFNGRHLQENNKGEMEMGATVEYNRARFSSPKPLIFYKQSITMHIDPPTDANNMIYEGSGND